MDGRHFRGTLHPDGDDLTQFRSKTLTTFLYTHRPGVAVGLGQALRACREVLDGIHDAVPEHAFYLTGGMADVLAAAERTPAHEGPSG